MRITTRPTITPGRKFYTVQDWMDESIAVGKQMVFAHRGAGELLAPDNTMEAAQLGASLRFGVEMDCHKLLGGDDCAMIHDSTVDAVTTSTGPVAGFTIPAWRSLDIDCNSWFAWGYPDTKPVTLDDVIVQVGGLTVLCLEVKSGAARLPMARTIQRYGIERSVFVNSFSLADLPTFTSMGVECGVNMNSGLEYTYDQVRAAGVRFVLISHTAADAVIQGWANAGFFVILWTIARHYQVDRGKSLGAVGHASSDPLWSAQDPSLYRTASDKWAQIRPYAGDLIGQEGQATPLDQNPSAAFRGARSGGWWTCPAGAVGRYMMLGFACPLVNPQNYTITGEMRFDDVATDPTRWLGIVLSSTRDYYVDGAADNAYAAILRVNGQLQIFRRTGAAVTSLGFFVGTPVVTGQVVPFTVNVTPTSITITRNDNAETVTVNDSTHRGPYAFVGKNAGAVSAFQGSFRGVTVT